MRKLLFSAVAGMIVIAGPSGLSAKTSRGDNSLTARERAEGWTLLFNGQNLDGWQAYGGGAPTSSWVVRDGTLMLTADSGKMSGSDLVTGQEYGSFELTLDWKVEKGGNSGVLYLAQNGTPDRAIYETGLEMQILDNADHPDGKIPSHRAGALYDLTVPPPSAAHPAGEWNHARLRVEPSRIRQWLNGTLTADVSYGDAAWRHRVAKSKFAAMPTFGTLSRGVIGLQDHGEPVAFRNIKLRRLDARGK